MGKSGPKFGFRWKHLDSTLHPSTLDIAWAAGIIEGEGSILATKNKTRYTSVTVQVPQKDPWLLNRLRELFGGSVSKVPKSGCYTWYLAGSRARGFAMTIFSFMSPKRKSEIKRALFRDGKSIEEVSNTSEREID